MSDWFGGDSGGVAKLREIVIEVEPFLTLSTACMSAPLATRICTTDRCPLLAASCIIGPPPLTQSRHGKKHN
jgi:hypothetical protein